MAASGFAGSILSGLKKPVKIEPEEIGAPKMFPKGPLSKVSICAARFPALSVIGFVANLFNNWVPRFPVPQMVFAELCPGSS